MDLFPINLTVVVGDDGRTRILVAGELDHFTGALLSLLLEDHVPPTTLDLSGVVFCDGGGLDHLVAAAGRGITAEDGTVPETVRQVAQLAGVDLRRPLAEPPAQGDG